MTTQQLTPEQEKEMLEGATFAVREGQSPLRCFKGSLGEIKVSMEQPRQQTGTPRLLKRFTFKYSNVNVCRAGSLCNDPKCIGSVVPWPWPTAELSFIESDSATSTFGILAASINKITGTKGTRLMETKGKVWHIKWTPDHDMRQFDNEKKDWVDVKGEAYVCLSLDGKAAPGIGQEATAGIAMYAEDIISYLVKLADGKSQAQFNMAAFQDSRIKADTAIFSALVNSEEAYMQSLIVAGKLTRDAQGVYHKA